MKIKTGVTVYHCDHCKKKMFRKGAMEHHEKWCPKSPENIKACTYCSHLEETEVTVYWDGYDGSHESKRKGFRCTKLDKLLYPLSVQRRGLDGRFPEHFEEQEPMPKECEHTTYIPFVPY
jgi:hypothetical protein